MFNKKEMKEERIGEIKMKVVCVSNVDWDSSWQRHQTFMTGLAKYGHEIFYINNTGFARLRLKDIKRIFQRYSKNKFKNPKHFNIYSFSPLIAPYGIPFNNFLNRYILYNQIFKNIPVQPDILYTYLPTQFTLDLIRYLRPKSIIYDYVTDFFSHPRKPKKLSIFHKKIIQQSKLVLTDSESCRVFLSSEHDNVHVVHHGVGKNFFEIRPAVLNSQIKRLCYFGTINSEVLDFELLDNLSQSNFEITLIGPQKGDPPPRNKNITTIEQVEVPKLAKLLEKQEAIILPYKKTAYNAKVMPAKIYQCLATGLPIVTIGLPLLVEQGLSCLIYLANTGDEFISYLKEIHLTESSALITLRKNKAKDFSEEKCLERLNYLINNMVS